MSNLDSYARFSSDNPLLDFTFLYPADWQAIEIKGKEKAYTEVFIRGPRNAENTYSLSLVVRVMPISEKEGRWVDLKAVAADYVAKSKGLAGFREVSRAEGRLADVEAIEIEMGYMMPLPLNAVNPKKTQIIERKVFLKRGSYFYELAYTAVEEDYYKYLDAFRNASRTLEFREEEANRQVYWSVVSPASAHAVHEKPTEYKAQGKKG
jgi:hypothetical protein